MQKNKTKVFVIVLLIKLHVTLCVHVFSYVHCSCLDFSCRLWLPAEWTWLKQEMANRQQICGQSKCSDPFLRITEHASNWKQTSKEHPPSSPHAQLHPRSVSPPFRFAHHPFWKCYLKTNGKFRSNGRKTNRNEGERERRHLNKRSSAQIRS